MPYNLIVTTAKSRTFVSARSPYAERKDAQRTVAVMVAPTVYDEDVDKETDFAYWVTAAPLGETVTHPASGLSFRTEEV